MRINLLVLDTKTLLHNLLKKPNQKDVDSVVKTTQNQELKVLLHVKVPQKVVLFLPFMAKIYNLERLILVVKNQKVTREKIIKFGLSVNTKVKNGLSHVMLIVC